MTTMTLPADLAPTLRTAVEELVAECGLAPVVQPGRDSTPRRDPPRCTVCHRAGRLSGHHAADGGIVWIHRGCHRRLHRAGRA